ncbi:MAG TPA: polysaccharide deacetylase family protein [Candidatus Paceibacterota bacterium]
MNTKGTFVISIDYEYGLGFADHDLTLNEKAYIGKEVAITKRLLNTFDRYHIPATWAVVGHLLERACTWKGNISHPEYVRPVHRREQRDWFLHHPVQGTYDDAEWFDPHGLIDEIAKSPVKHEIASHSYAHIMYDEESTEEQNVFIDLKNMIHVHHEANLPVTSFIFPRNREGRHALLKKVGVQCYRGAPKQWYEGFPGIIKRGLHVFDYFLPFSRTVMAGSGEGGLVNIPGSMLLLGRGGLRKIIPVWLMKWKLKHGIQKSIDRGEIFHVWFHPSNFWHDTDVQFSILENMLEEAVYLRKTNKLEIVTMQQIASHLII